MGIRYDRDTRRATNGPLIFFSDASAEGGFAEEIRGALISGLSFYGYRLPNSPMVSFGSSEGYVEGIGEPGFVVAMFDSGKPFITIPYKGGKRREVTESLYRMPNQSTTKEEYISEVESFIKAIEENRATKIVAARVEIREKTPDIADIFFDLCKRFPDAFIFCFGTPATGCWVGASPELLLEGKSGLIQSMALAGTRSSEIDSEWDDKNIEEQKIVADYICNLFKRNGLDPILEETFSKRAGTLEHLCTPIYSRITPDYSSFSLPELLRALYPTPALCGSPKEAALEEIKKIEKFDRGCYGGFCGPFHSLEDFNFYVTIRCASVEENRHCIYAGGGIISQSDPFEEWEETELKIRNTFK